MDDPFKAATHLRKPHPRSLIKSVLKIVGIYMDGGIVELEKRR